MPRFEVNGTRIPPGYFADDNAMMLKGNSSDAIINVLDKISVYEMVSGLQLNLTKCEFLAINCDEGMINHLVSQTGMKRVQSMKNLGTWINENGEATEEKNIIPVLETIKGIERRLVLVQLVECCMLNFCLGRGMFTDYRMWDCLMI